MQVVATAGHVDHGKSSLVLALTGTDPDRLAEEKARGLTIDLGFAFLTLPSGTQVGFVDVPGHVRFLKNMLAGVGAVRAAVLVVAATEGWMPQSEEHLRILELLGVDHGFTVITKADLVDDETLELARLEVADHLAGTFLAEAPVVTCDSLSGRGLDEVREALGALVGSLPPPDPGPGRPRLWIDRAFTARGAGTVVTGTLTGGSLTVDDELLLVPQGRPVRVRGLQSAHAPVERATPGSRVAVNLSGVDREHLRRGDALVRPGQWEQARVADARLHLLEGVRLRPRARVKAYVGSGEHDAVVRDLGEGFARLFLATALPLVPGDRVILRDPGPDVTLGGAEVLDVSPTTRAREAPEVLRLPLGRRLLASRSWVSPDDLARLGGLGPEEAEATAAELVAAGAAVGVRGGLVEAGVAASLLERAAAETDRHHAQAPLEPGIDLAVLAARLATDPDDLRALVQANPDAGLVVEHGRVRRPGHRVKAATHPAGRRLLEALEASPFSPPSPGELGVPPQVVRALVREGRVLEVEGVLMTPEALEEATRRIGRALAERGALTVAEVRDLLGTTRKFVLPLLNHLDATGVTRRRGDERVAGPRLQG